MASACVEIIDKNKQVIRCRMLLDTCATANFITERLMKKLDSPRSVCSLNIGGLDNLSTSSNSYAKVTFKSIYSTFRKTLNFFIISQITDRTPSEPIPRDKLNIEPNLKLADPNFHRPGPVDLLIGTGPALSMVSAGQLVLAKDPDLILQKTKLGWIVGGGCNFTKKSTLSGQCMITNSDFDLQKFWQIDKTPETIEFSNEDVFCEEHFKKHVQRTSSGRYIVSLPFKEKAPELGNSKTKALRCLQYMLKRFSKNPELEENYTQAIQEFIDLGFMVPADPAVPIKYYLPHHVVIKESSSTTKYRVVFNASAPTSHGVSLNDVLAVGPTIQPSLFTLLLNFRFHPIVVTADIEKMYPQVLVSKFDQQFQGVLWKVNGIIREFVINRLTFGITPASFLAIRVLHQLAKDEGSKYPLAARALTSKMYVDNMLTGSKNVTEAQNLIRQMKHLLATAGMKMRQWASNVPETLAEVDQKDLDANFSLDPDNPIKTLGMFWKARTDSYVFEIKQILLENFTKRIILSIIARIFDPLGLLGPIILYAKLIIKLLWKAKLQWDEPVPGDILEKWTAFCIQLNSKKIIIFKRNLFKKRVIRIEMHGFGDACKAAYGACIYLKVFYSDGSVSVDIICSKSRVSPVSKEEKQKEGEKEEGQEEQDEVTIPRLELCGAKLLSDLATQVRQGLELQIDAFFWWCDNTTVLHWINTPYTQLKTFVSNRVKQIQNSTDVKDWRYVRSTDNPADCLSRGQTPDEFEHNTMWRHGPSWLSKPQDEWPRSDIPGLSSELPEKRVAKCLTLNPNIDTINAVIRKQSSLTKLKRIFALCLRFINAYKKARILKTEAMTPHCKKGIHIEVDKLLKAERIIVKFVQRQEFHKEITQLEKNQAIEEKNCLAGLDSFLDDEGLLRVGGKIRKAMKAYEFRHPILLPRKNHLTNLIIRFYHLSNYHTGVQNTLYLIREKYWPIHGRVQVKKVIRRCIPCFRTQPKIQQYKTGDLPSVRINVSDVFKNVGVDYCGPFHIKERKFRNRNMIKSYVALFICMATKAIHIELVTDLTSESFLAALDRFCNRRGCPYKMYSDNGSNFKGAHNELNELYELLNSPEHKHAIQNHLSPRNIKWSFIPPRAPNMGEANIKQFKLHLKRSSANRQFTYEQFYTFATGIEAILNSRPLTQMSSDPNDLRPLTPGHFLIGDSLKALPQGNYENIPTNRLSVWQHTTKLKQDFWKRWSKEYLSDLMNKKHTTKNPQGLEIGALVLIKEDNLPPLEWKMGRIMTVHPGDDNIVRVVTLKTTNGILKRPTSKIAVLPVQSDENN